MLLNTEYYPYLVCPLTHSLTDICVYKSCNKRNTFLYISQPLQTLLPSLLHQHGSTLNNIHSVPLKTGHHWVYRMVLKQPSNNVSTLNHTSVCEHSYRSTCPLVASSISHMPGQDHSDHESLSCWWLQKVWETIWLQYIHISTLYMIYVLMGSSVCDMGNSSCGWYQNIP